MDIQDELDYLFPLPLKVNDRELYHLSVSQVLTFLHRSRIEAGLAEFFIQEHGIMDRELVELYHASLNLLTLPQDQKKLYEKKENQANFGGEPKKESTALNIIPNLLAVAKIANMSLKDVLAMPISHYNLCLWQVRDNYEAEKEAYEKGKR